MKIRDKKDPRYLIAKTLINRSYIYMCSYETTWFMFMNHEDKKGFTYDDIHYYLNNGYLKKG